MNPIRSLTLVVAMVLLFPTESSASPSYFFSNVIDSSGDLSRFRAPIAINSNGEIVFRANTDSGASGIYKMGANGLTTIADNTGPLNLFETPYMDDAGTVVFYAHGDEASSSGIYIHRAGTLSSVASDSPSFKVRSRSPLIDPNGRVVFVASTPGAGNGIYSTNGTSITTLASPGTVGIEVLLHDIDSHGTLLISASTVLSGEQLLLYKDGIITDQFQAGPAIGRVSLPVFNDEGTIAFYSNLGRGGLYIFEDGELTDLALLTSGYSVTGSPSIDDEGTVVFAAYRGGSLGIYSSKNPTDPLIERGDSLFGSTINGGLAFRGNGAGLNDKGQFAFRYSLNNGIEGIALATPVPIAPAIFFLMSGLAGLTLQVNQRASSQVST